MSDLAIRFMGHFYFDLSSTMFKSIHLRDIPQNGEKTKDSEEENCDSFSMLVYVYT